MLSPCTGQVGGSGEFVPEASFNKWYVEVFGDKYPNFLASQWGEVHVRSFPEGLSTVACSGDWHNSEPFLGFLLSFPCSSHPILPMVFPGTTTILKQIACICILVSESSLSGAQTRWWDDSKCPKAGDTCTKSHCRERRPSEQLAEFHLCNSPPYPSGRP